MSQISEKSSEKYTRTEDYREKKRRTCLLVAPIGTEYQVLTLRDYWLPKPAATWRAQQQHIAADSPD